ncbi:MAG: bifunctional DNA-formamidopyrimidine glycosylase/DNA-(apurinic or apyrimidinic site) lyase [Betaproteobacteria bacterium]|nr:bifunctional DNA-formamidopyrimidine glycosylase/DNA-(apurinic or apyrimidinic site) lyase [Betaproteobacteria bacterium]NCA16604.1 bifunctional DNA-formamidopyrimidine glycosylase/DNA-(apurinic or apyrimidinic site) lyase [Betaproteobacteria bacterium]
MHHGTLIHLSSLDPCAMPELPEVEVVCRQLSPLLAGQSLQGVGTSGKSLRSFSGRPQGLSPLLGQSVRGLTRRAKNLLLVFDHHQLALHLGMSGVLSWCPGRDSPPKQSVHEHLWLVFDRGLLLYTDPRRFGDARLIDGDEAPSRALGVGSSGLEPLEASFNGEALTRAAQGVRQAVKVWLMRGDVVVGVGNIYASEALHRAGIHPARAAGRIRPERLARLVHHIKEVLEEAIREGGSTLRDFKDAAGVHGGYGERHRVYGRAGQPCLSCGTHIRRMVQAQRATYYCHVCQR